MAESEQTLGLPKQGVLPSLLHTSLPPTPHPTAPSYHSGGLGCWVPALVLRKWNSVLQALSFLLLHLGRTRVGMLRAQGLLSLLFLQIS